MTEEQFVYDVLTDLQGHHPTQDREITYAQVAFKLAALRSQLIRQTVNKNKGRINQAWVQDLGKVDLESTSVADPYDIAGAEHVLRTVRTLPKALEMREANPFVFVGALDGHTPFFWTTLPVARLRGFLRRSSRLTRVVQQEDDLVVYSLQKIKHMRVKGVFDNPEQAHLFNPENKTLFKTTPYPLPGSLQNSLHTMCLEQFGIAKQFPPDYQVDERALPSA